MSVIPHYVSNKRCAENVASIRQEKTIAKMSQTKTNCSLMSTNYSIASVQFDHRFHLWYSFEHNTIHDSPVNVDMLLIVGKSLVSECRFHAQFS